MLKKVKKGFTLVELMIVVAIIGILAAIAIPNFLRYQLRTKAGERKINLEAIFKAEESLRQSERVIRAGVQPGQYLAFNAIPSGNVGTGKIPWLAVDLNTAQQIDWIVQGSTYGRYAANAATVSNVNVAISMCAWTDIDGDGTQYAGDGMWNPQLAADGTVQTAPEDAPCDAKVEQTVHDLTYTHESDAMGRPVQLSADNVF